MGFSARDLKKRGALAGGGDKSVGAVADDGNELVHAG
jgi:hypothetical protein